MSWHPVSKDVGNVRNQDPTLTQPVELDVKTGKPIDKKNAKSAGLMANWLKKGTAAAKTTTAAEDKKTQIKEEQDDDPPDEKRVKKE